MTIFANGMNLSQMVQEAIEALPLGASNGNIIDYISRKYSVTLSRKYVSDVKSKIKDGNLQVLPFTEELSTTGKTATLTEGVKQLPNDKSGSFVDFNKSVINEITELKKVRKCDAVREAFKDLSSEASNSAVIKYVKDEYGIEVDTDYVSYRKYEDKRLKMSTTKQTNESTRNYINLSSKQLCTLFDTIREYKSHFLTTRPTRIVAAEFLTNKLRFKITAAHVARAQDATGITWKRMTVEDSKGSNSADIRLLASCLLSIEFAISNQMGSRSLTDDQRTRLSALRDDFSNMEDE